MVRKDWNYRFVGMQKKLAKVTFSGSQDSTWSDILGVTGAVLFRWKVHLSRIKLLFKAVQCPWISNEPGVANDLLFMCTTLNDVPSKSRGRTQSTQYKSGWWLETIHFWACFSISPLSVNLWFIMWKHYMEKIGKCVNISWGKEKCRQKNIF